MAQYIEDFLPPIQSAGLNTLENTKIAANLSYQTEVLGSTGNTTITAAQSGGTLLFDTGSSVTYTLPAPVVGLRYDFVVSTTPAGGTYKVQTNSSSTTLYGALLLSSSTAVLMASGTGVSVAMNGTISGGRLGTRIEFICTSATTWAVTGVIAGSGTLVTPFLNT